MKFPIAILASLTAFALVQAQETPAPEIDKSVIDSLFGEHSTIAAFTDAIRFAEQAGVPSQTLVEAETRYYLFNNRDYASIRKLIKKLDDLAGGFDPEESRLFGSKDEFTAMVEFAKAVLAFEAEDTAALKKHVTEAIWLHPRYARQFSSLIISHRMILQRRADQLKNGTN